jgi:hypothetical protein
MLILEYRDWIRKTDTNNNICESISFKGKLNNLSSDLVGDVIVIPKRGGE